MKIKTCTALFLAIILVACSGDDYTPKPMGYFRIDLPAKEYEWLEKDCPFTCELPTYTSLAPNINNPNKKCWFNINFDGLNASIWVSYKPLDGNLDQFLEDSRTLAFKHTIKAHDIEQQIISYPERNVYGLIYNIKGNAASSYQFHITDSTNHFFRGSLYFNNIPNQDSIQPVLDFVTQDIDHLLATFKWK